jgi:hypothetical protein
VAWKCENFTLSLISALDECEWASSRSSRLSPWYGLDGTQCEPYRSPVYVDEETPLLLQRVDPWAVHLFEQRQ